MPEISLNGARPIAAPPFFTSLEDTGPVEDPMADDFLLAEFEELMPAGECGAAPATDVDDGAALPTLGTSQPLDAADACEAKGRAGSPLAEASAGGPEAPSAEFSIHHARIGVVHVRQQADGSGGSIRLRTDDAGLRERLRLSTADLRAVMGYAHGHGPEVEIDA